MEPSKVIDFLHSYPSWFRVTIVLWVFATAVVISGLLLVQRGSRGVPNENVPPAPSAQALSSQLKTVQAPAIIQTSAASPFESFDAYMAHWKATEDRFAQREAFEDESKGVTVDWAGAVYSASGFADSASSVSITVDSLADSNRYFYVVAPRSYRALAAGLRRGDRISVSGELEAGGLHPRVAATKIEVQAGDG